MDDGELLRQVMIAEPCAVGWDTMPGDDRVRFCSQCDKHVYNLAAMPVKEAAALVRAKDGKLCGRILARADQGAVVTAPRRPVRRGQFHIRLIMAVVAGVGTLLGLTRAWWGSDDGGNPTPSGRGVLYTGRICLPPSVLSQPDDGSAEYEPE